MKWRRYKQIQKKQTINKEQKNYGSAMESGVANF